MNRDEAIDHARHLSDVDLTKLLIEVEEQLVKVAGITERLHTHRTVLLNELGRRSIENLKRQQST